MPNVLARMIIRFSARTLSMILSESRVSKDGLETGGILLGYDYGSEDLIEVTQAGDPGPRAQRARRRFLRDLDHARSLADIAYDTNGSVWLGEWHTHPNEGPLPSPRDLSTYLSLLADESLDFERVTSVIVTSDSPTDWKSLSLWPWVVTSQLVQLAICSVIPGASRPTVESKERRT